MLIEDRRLRLQSVLESILGSGNVYFQPPASMIMEYPCIVYSFTGTYGTKADNIDYLTSDAYDVTLITKDPVFGEVNERILEIPHCRFSRKYTADNLHHFSYSLRITGKD